MRERNATSRRHFLATAASAVLMAQLEPAQVFAGPATRSSLPRPRDPLIAFWLIGGSSTDAAMRFAGGTAAKRGWAAFIKADARQALDWGAKRLWLHNPFGYAPDQSMRFAQAVEAKRAYPRLTDGFVEAWKPITASGIEVVGYVGSPVTLPAGG